MATCRIKSTLVMRSQSTRCLARTTRRLRTRHPATQANPVWHQPLVQSGRTGFAAFLAIFTVCLLHGVAPAAGQEFDEKFDHWPLQHRIPGKIVVHGGTVDLENSGMAELVGELEVVHLVAGAELPDALGEELARTAQGYRNVNWLAHSTEELEAQLQDSRCVYLGPTSVAALPALREHLSSLQRVVNSGGTLIVDIAAAPLLGRYAAVGLSGGQPLELRQGLNLIPDSILFGDDEIRGAEFADPATASQRLMLALLNLQPECVGIQFRGAGSLTLDQRRFRFRGPGSATFRLAANERQPVFRQVIEQRKSRRQDPAETTVDLTQLRRMAIDRGLPAFPPAEPPVPHVAKGTLFIVGGGGMPSGLMQQFVESAGGENARLVYVPCSEQDDVGTRHRTVAMWEQMGVASATFIHTKDREQANSDPEFMAALKDATGIWFGGGRQWNFSDSYYGTQTHQLMKQVLQRGGVIGGSSAGASIQARYLARATPIGNFDPMAPGYERGGLGFIGGVAIDQHFSQRRRQQDMTQLVDTYPQLLGIGIDEATALIVRGSTAQVVGRGQVFFYDRRLPVYPDQPDFLALPAGSSYDLARRVVVEDSREDQ